MTDSEIVKALECCIKGNCITKNCPLEGTEDISSRCEAKLMRSALDLINRLQTENEEKQKVIDNFKDIGKLYSEIKAEAYKEFAERLKIRFSGTISCNYGAIKQAADKLIKEFGGSEV